jgi:hypothetical protein
MNIRQAIKVTYLSALSQHRSESKSVNLRIKSRRELAKLSDYCKPDLLLNIGQTRLLRNALCAFFNLKKCVHILGFDDCNLAFPELNDQMCFEH